MIKAKDTIGLKVITLDNGKNINTVKDVIYDPRENKVKALLIDEAGWFSDAKVLLIENIKSIGPDSVIIENEQMVKKASDAGNQVKSTSKSDKFLTQTKIVTEKGIELGSVSDLLFDEKTGNVLELEVSQGIENLKSGKKHVKVSDIITVGEDATIVSAYTEQELEQQKGGMEGMIEEAKVKAPQAIQQAKKKIQELQQSDQAQNAQNKVKKSTQQTQQKLQDFTNKPEVQETQDTMQYVASTIKDAAVKKARDAFKGVEKVAQEKQQEDAGKLPNRPARNTSQTGQPQPVSNTSQPLKSPNKMGEKKTPDPKSGAVYVETNSNRNK